MIFCLQADAEEAEVEEVTRPRDSVLVRLGDVERDVQGWDVSHISPPWVASSRMDHVYLGSCRAPGLLCYALFQLILT